MKHLAVFVALATPIFVISCAKGQQPAEEQEQSQEQQGQDQPGGEENQPPFTPDGTWTVVGTINGWNERYWNLSRMETTSSPTIFSA